MSRIPENTDKLCLGEGKFLPILPRGSLIRPFEWVIGYIEVQKDHYVAVIGGFFHLFTAIWYFLKRTFKSKIA